MIEFAVRSPDDSDSFHRLLKVVAIVDAPSHRRGSCSITSRPGIRDRDHRPLRPRRLGRRRRRRVHRDRSTASGASRRAGWRGPSATSGSGRRSGRSRIRIGLPTSPCWHDGEVEGYIYLGQQTPAFYAKQVVASIVNTA